MIRWLILFLALAAAPARANFVLTVSTTGPKSPSVIYSSNPATGINCGSSSTACSASFASGAVVNLTATVGSTVTFAGWTYADGCATNSKTCRVTMHAATPVAAAFNPIIGLRLYGNGLGTVTTSSGLVNCTWLNGCARGAMQTYSFAKGTQLVLRANPVSSSTFAGWSGDAGCSHASTCTFTVNGYEVITATFASYGPFTIAINLRGGGSVRSSPAGIVCGPTCAAQFSSGTVVHLSTLAAAGYFFAGWSNGGCSGLTPCVVTSSSAQQGLRGAESPSAFFYRTQ